jgi:hypothetical protein
MPILAFAVRARAQSAQDAVHLLGVASGSLAAPAGAGLDTDGGAGSILARLGDSPADYGRLVAVHDSGLNPYTDTPGFANFTSVLGKTGDCMGISYITQQLFLRVRWAGPHRHDRDCFVRELREVLAGMFLSPLIRRRATVCGFAHLREASRSPKVADALRRLMAAGQLRTLHPEIWRLFTALPAWHTEHAKLASHLDSGTPVVMAMNTPGKKDGHAILAYKLVEFERRSLIFVYDSNAGPRPGSTAPTYLEGADGSDATTYTVLVYDRANRQVGFHRRYGSLLWYPYTNFVVYEGPDFRGMTRRAIADLRHNVGRTLRRLLPITPLERGLQLFSRAHELVRRHLGLPF